MKASFVTAMFVLGISSICVVAWSVEASAMLLAGGAFFAGRAYQIAYTEEQEDNDNAGT